jgi:hypothetical protein
MFNTLDGTHTRHPVVISAGAVAPELRCAALLQTAVALSRIRSEGEARAVRVLQALALDDRELAGAEALDVLTVPPLLCVENWVWGFNYQCVLRERKMF